MRELTTVLLVTLCFSAITGGDPEKRTPADELKALQGSWRVMESTMDRSIMPKEALLNDKGAELVFDGNRITHDGKTVVTLANDVILPSAEKEIGEKDSRLLMLTLLDGKGFLCNYRIVGDEVRIRYPHTSFCNRSGYSVVLKRPSK
jgi:hypothetical protein